MPYPQKIVDRLQSHYEEFIWLAKRPFVTPGQARGWYSQIMGHTLASKIRLFSGMASKKAIENPSENLVLEHYSRLSFELSCLIKRHIKENIEDSNEFIELIERCERVHITTNAENQQVQATKGCYRTAGIDLVEWSRIEPMIREKLYPKLKNKVCNANDFHP